jgi:hypothetical protein
MDLSLKHDLQSYHCTNMRKGIQSYFARTGAVMYERRKLLNCFCFLFFLCDALALLGIDRCLVGPSELRQAAMHGPLIVGVFADQTVEEVNQIANECDLDIIQLSGVESVSNALEYNRPLVKAVHVGADSSVDEVLSGIKAINPITGALSRNAIKKHCAWQQLPGPSIFPLPSLSLKP